MRNAIANDINDDDFQRARVYAKASNLSDEPVGLDFTCYGTRSCYFVYYGIWRYCVKYLAGRFDAEPYFCELFPVCKEKINTPDFAYDSDATNHVIENHLKRMDSKSQIIILNGWSPKDYEDNDSIRCFFLDVNPERTGCLMERLKQRLRDDFHLGRDHFNAGIGPPDPFAFVTSRGFVCLRTYHSAGKAAYRLWAGHLLKAMQTCLNFAAPTEEYLEATQPAAAGADCAV